MPPPGYRTVTMSERLYGDLLLLKVRLNCDSVAQVIQKLYRLYAFGESP